MFAMMDSHALMTFALQEQKTQTKMDALTKLTTQDVTMDLDAPEMFAVQTQKMQLMVALMKAWTLNVTMDSHVLMMLAHQEMKMLMKTDAYSLPIQPTAMITLTVPLMLVHQTMQMLIMMVVFTDRSTLAVTMDSDAPEIFAVLTLKMPLMVALMKVWTLNAMMDLLALKILAHQETKVLMKMDA